MQEHQFVNTIIYSAIAAFSTIVGVYILFVNEKWVEKRSHHFLSFAAGVVLTTAFLHMMPEAIELAEVKGALAVVLFTIIGFYIVEHMIAIHTCQEGECHVHSMGVPAFIGIVLHSFVDGMVIGVGFEVDFSTGLLSTLAIFLHSLPVGITIAAILKHAGFARKKIFLLGWAVAAAMVLGAAGAYVFVRDMESSLIGLLLAFSAGTFLYIGAADLLPETHKKMHRFNIIFVLLGVALVYIISSVSGGH
ncbi:MAG: ZIP family metal transporter [Deltaproteobacteria bacterium]|nr:ZIP family metal transporter [Deltaproteobacteria bacterium]